MRLAPTVLVICCLPHNPNNLILDYFNTETEFEEPSAVETGGSMFGKRTTNSSLIIGGRLFRAEPSVDKADDVESTDSAKGRVMARALISAELAHAKKELDDASADKSPAFLISAELEDDAITDKSPASLKREVVLLRSELARKNVQLRSVLQVLLFFCSSAIWVYISSFSVLLRVKVRREQ
jgi:hypothetical protein